MGVAMKNGAGCAHCGLAVRAGDAYCCFGCELAAEIRREARDDHAPLLATLNFALVLSMLVMMLALFLYAEDVYGASGDTELAWMRSAYRIASAVLATPVMLLAGVPLLRGAWRRLRGGRLSMEALIAAGAFAAYGLSIGSLLSSGTRIYFDSATTAVVLATLGRYLEARARSGASQRLGPALEEVRRPSRIRTPDGIERDVSPAEIEPGSTVIVAVDRMAPVDLRLERDAAEVSLAVVTGESAPVSLARGDLVPAGAVPISEGLDGVALRSARSSTLERLAELSRALREERSDLIRWADELASGLTPLVAIIALSVLGYWTYASGIEHGVVTALAVVLVACPCTYAIATPLVHWLSLRRALAKGVLIRSAEVLESAAKVRRIAFDKTGTLTDSELEARPIAGSVGGEVSSIVRALERDSTHPVARALLELAGDHPPAELLERRFVPGRGVEGIDLESRRLTLGPTRDDAGGAIVLERDGAVLARFELRERVRAEALEAKRALSEIGVKTIVLSGDHPARVARVASLLGLEYLANLRPEEKIARLRELGGETAMVGDGINDAPALAGAHLSIAVGGATPLAAGLADITLLEADLRLVPFTLALARSSVRTVKRLLVFSTAYNAIFIALAASGALRPVWAGLSMLVSSLVVLGFALAAGKGGWDAAEGEEPRLELERA
jgi:heavy metal translocating P-type ATPase